MLDYLLNKTAVFYRPRRFRGIVKNRLMMRLGLVQLDILADSCLKDNVSKIGADSTDSCHPIHGKVATQTT
jgi:hypothetical protein